MKWFDKWFYKQAKKAWDSKDRYEMEEESKRILSAKEKRSLNMSGLQIGTAMVERGPVEGQDRISFELTSAVGGRILNVRRYDERKDQHATQTYVIPSGEDVGARVAKIINLELLK
jgi:hypothetical protein